MAYNWISNVADDDDDDVGDGSEDDEEKEHDSDEDDGDDANLRHHCKAWRITVVMLILTTGDKYGCWCKASIVKRRG